MNIGLGTPLVSVGRQKDFLRIVALGAAFGVALNLLLIPGFGAMGAGVGTLVDEALVLLMFLADRPEIPVGKTALRLARCVAAAVPAVVAATAMARWVAGGHVPAASVVAGGLVGSAVYLGATFLLGIDVLRLAESLRRWPNGSSEVT